MNTVRLIRKFNQLIVVLSSLLIVDLLLPLHTEEAIIIDYHRAAVTGGKYSSRTKSSDELIVTTTEGRIKVKPTSAIRENYNHRIILYSTYIFQISKQLELNNGRLLKSNNMLFSWFSFVPLTMLLFGVVTLLLKSEKSILNIGTANFGFLLLLLYLL